MDEDTELDKRKADKVTDKELDGLKAR